MDLDEEEEDLAAEAEQNEEEAEEEEEEVNYTAHSHIPSLNFVSQCWTDSEFTWCLNKALGYSGNRFHKETVNF